MPLSTFEAVVTVGLNNPQKRESKSLRVTIPAVIAHISALKPGDRLRWSIDLQSGRIEVRKEPKRVVPRE